MEKSENSEEKWELASDKTFRKLIIQKGSGLICPRDGSICKIKIQPLQETSSQLILERSKKFGTEIDTEKEIVVGEHDTEFDDMLDKILEHMKPGEISDFSFQLNRTERTTLEALREAPDFISVKIRLELLSFGEVPEIWELNPAQLVDAARHHKNQGVEWFRSGNFVYALRRFMTAMRYLIVIDKEMMEKLAKENGDAAVLNEEYRALMANVYTNIAAVQLKSQHFSSVIEICSKALNLDRKNVKALYRRGVAYVRSGNSSLAKTDFLEALKFAPNDSTIRNELRSIKEI